MMFKAQALVIGLLVLVLVSSGLCVEEEKFVYDSKRMRDPFVPLITDTAKISVGLINVETIEDINLEGLIWDPEGNSLVILNGVVLKENQQVYNVRVTKIEPKRVSIVINESEFIIDLYKKVKREGE